MDRRTSTQSYSPVLQPSSAGREPRRLTVMGNNSASLSPGKSSQFLDVDQKAGRRVSMFKPESSPIYNSIIGPSRSSFAVKSPRQVIEEGKRLSFMESSSNFQAIKVNSEEKKTECGDRCRRMKKIIEEMSEVRELVRDMHRVVKKIELDEETNKICKLADDFFCVANIQVKELTEGVNDSSMSVYPIEDKALLSNFYYLFCQEILDFPFSFLSKIKVQALTMSEEVALVSPAHAKVLRKKMHNGLCVTKHMNTKEKVRDHWYKIVIYHFFKAVPDFADRWNELFGSINPEKGKVEDLIATLTCLTMPELVSKADVPNLNQKLKFLKEEIKNVDPDFFSEDFWEIKGRGAMF